MKKSLLQDRYLVSCLLEKKCDTKKQMLQRGSELATACLFHMYVNFFHYLTLCLRVLNHSHIWWIRKQMKSCGSCFHATLPLRLVGTTQSCIMLRLNWDSGVIIIQHSYNISIRMVLTLIVSYIEIIIIKKT